MPEDVNLGSESTCFIVSPIGNRLEPIGSAGRNRFEESMIMWEQVLEPACAAFGLSPVRADRISDTGEIPDQIFTYLRDADVVIADLSHANPNVMYELGLRHSRPGKTTIQIGEYGYLPFDVTTIRTIQFNRTTAGLVGAREDLVAALRTALSGGGSQLRATEIFADRADGQVDIASDVMKSVAPEQGSFESQEPGLLEVLAESELALTHVTDVLTRSGQTIGEISGAITTSTDRVTASDSSGGGFAGRLLVARELGEALDEPATMLVTQGDEFISDVRKTDALVQFVVERLSSGEEDQLDSANFIGSVIGLVDASEEAAVGITTFREGARDLRRFSTALAPASNQIVLGTGKFLEGINIISSWRTLLSPFAQQ